MQVRFFLLDLDLDLPFLKRTWTRTWTCPFKVDLDLDLDLAVAGLVTSLCVTLGHAQFRSPSARETFSNWGSNGEK